MKVNVKSLLKDKNVLYVIAFIAAINLVGFLMTQNLNAVLFMFIVGFLTSYFSKNMIIVLLTALIATNLFATSRSIYVRSGKEGFKEGLSKKQKRKLRKKAKKAVKKVKKTGTSASNKRKKSSSKKVIPPNQGDYDNATEGDNVVEGMRSKSKSKKGGSKLDYAATLESAYDGLEGLLGSSAIKSMSKDTQRLAEKQKKLMKNIENLEPMMQRAGKMLEGLESSKIGGMLTNLESSMAKLGGMKFNKRKKE